MRAHQVDCRIVRQLAGQIQKMDLVDQGPVSLRSSLALQSDILFAHQQNHRTIEEEVERVPCFRPSEMIWSAYPM